MAHLGRRQPQILGTNYASDVPQLAAPSSMMSSLKSHFLEVLSDQSRSADYGHDYSQARCPGRLVVAVCLPGLLRLGRTESEHGPSNVDRAREMLFTIRVHYFRILILIKQTI